jgi:Domain of unknown function (DUF4169)
MTEIINLKQKRKGKAREDKEKAAEANRRKFGRTKSEKELEKQRAEQTAKHIDGHKRETNNNED